MLMQQHEPVLQTPSFMPQGAMNFALGSVSDNDPTGLLSYIPNMGGRVVEEI